MRDNELVQRSLQGDKTAFEELVRRYYDLIRLTAFSILQDQDEAEDVAQETFLKAYCSLNQLRDASSFSIWLRRIACNFALQRLRRRERFSFIPIDKVSPRELAVFPFDERREELIDEVMRVIDELPEEERGLLRGRYLEGRGYRELAEEYGLSYNAILVKIHRARRKVKEKVLRRLRCVVILPWREIVKVMGGVVMKMTTKIVIIGSVLMIAVGTSIWMVHHGGKEHTSIREVKEGRDAGDEISSQRSLSGGRSQIVENYPKEERSPISKEKFPETSLKSLGEEQALLEPSRPSSEEEKIRSQVYEEYQEVIEKIENAISEVDQLLPRLKELDMEILSYGGPESAPQYLVKQYEEYRIKADKLHALLWDEEFVSLFGGWPRSESVVMELHEYLSDVPWYLSPRIDEMKELVRNSPGARRSFIEAYERILREYPNTELPESIKDVLREAYRHEQ